MAILATQHITTGGLDEVLAAASAGGDKLTAGDHTFLHVKNGAVAARTVTVVSPKPCSQGVNHNLVVNVPAGAERRIGPLPAGRFQGSDGKVSVTYDNEAGLTVAAVAA